MQRTQTVSSQQAAYLPESLTCHGSTIYLSSWARVSAHGFRYPGKPARAEHFLELASLISTGSPRLGRTTFHPFCQFSRKRQHYWLTSQHQLPFQECRSTFRNVMNINTLSNSLVNTRQDLSLAGSAIPPPREKCSAQVGFPGSLKPCAETPGLWGYAIWDLYLEEATFSSVWSGTIVWLGIQADLRIRRFLNVREDKARPPPPNSLTHGHRRCSDHYYMRNVHPIDWLQWLAPPPCPH